MGTAPGSYLLKAVAQTPETRSTPGSWLLTGQDGQSCRKETCFREGEGGWKCAGRELNSLVKRRMSYFEEQWLIINDRLHRNFETVY